jgi:hypothetical protein
MNLEKMLELTIAGREDIKKSLELEKLIKKYIAEEIANKKGGNKEKNRFKAAEKYLKESAKANTGRPQLHGSWIVDGKQYMSNSHSGIELVGDSILKGLTELKEDIQPFNLAEVIESGKANANIKQEVDLKVLKAQLVEAKAEAKANKVKLIEVDKAFTKIGEAYYDIDLLLRTIAILPGELEYYNSTALAPLMVLDDKGNSAIVLAIRK